MLDLRIAELVLRRDCDPSGEHPQLFRRSVEECGGGPNDEGCCWRLVYPGPVYSGGHNNGGAGRLESAVLATRGAAGHGDRPPHEDADDVVPLRCHGRHTRRGTMDLNAE